jgi:phospholipid/cholesterol/gamma-HCH transport system permease protein
LDVAPEIMTGVEAIQAEVIPGTSTGRVTLLDWTTDGLRNVRPAVIRQLEDSDLRELDLAKIGACDTSGAVLIAKAQSKGAILVSARQETARLIDLVRQALSASEAPPRRLEGALLALDRIGRAVVHSRKELASNLDFLGHLLISFGRLALNPGRLRMAALVSNAERAGLDAIPIVAMTSYFIGAVVGLLGANMFRQFGAALFSIDLVGISVLREFNILITALLLAGRSSSAFAAEIGSMKMNQEIDAMRIMGLDPFDTLVIPRFLGLLLTIPLLTFAATVTGLIGGATVIWVILDLSPLTFIQRLLDYVGPTQFWIGMSKAPAMAAAVAVIGCRHGMLVEGDVESLGRRVTAAVVQAIFAIIVIDALFALLYMELDL